MRFLKLYFKNLGDILNYPIHIYGKTISFMNIFAFVFIIAVIAIFIRNLFS